LRRRREERKIAADLPSNHKMSNKYPDESVDGSIDPAAVERAEAAVARLGERYLTEAQSELDALRHALEALPPRAEQSRGEIAELARMAHDIAGQGSLFGWPLMSQIGDALQLLLRDRANLGPSGRAITQAHLEAMETALRDGIQDTAEPRGRKLLAGLVGLEDD
jgi:HPt (histidine-containing phosphotransfer) domain-containing protein|tara:strand:+ start:82 stop:576 length:495 start_codon:yes stop_codon:yes gene_type:complete